MRPVFANEVPAPEKGTFPMKYVMLVQTLLAVVLVGVFAAPARADECNKLTYLTFSAPVAFPGVTLPAGTYQFIHPDCSEHVLRVSSQDGSTVYGTFLTIPDDRVTPTDESEVIFNETPAGSPETIKAWFYPGEITGDELIYGPAETPRVAGTIEQKVMASTRG
jgi:hypothetical protein